MKERPILFSAPMVRALLAGTKTQTRRVVRPRDLAWMDEHQGLREPDNAIRCPYGMPGDRLWVRETWAGPLVESEVPWEDWPKYKKPEFCRYAADGGPPPEYIDSDDNHRQRWTPSIHMYRWASRITLEVSAVRVERLQDISYADAIAEGLAPQRGDPGAWGLADGSHYHGSDPRISYWSLWEAINGAGSVAGNPWVWVVEFKRAQQEGGA